MNAKLPIVDPPATEVDAHPIVATQAILRDGPLLPGPAGQSRPSGRLSEANLETLVSIAEAIFSDNDVAPDPGRMTFLYRELDDFMSRASGRGRLLFAVGAFLLSAVAPWFIGELGPLRRLSLADRVRALSLVEHHPLGQILIPLRAILCLLYFEHPDAARDIGIDVDRLRPLPPSTDASMVIGDAPGDGARSRGGPA